MSSNIVNALEQQIAEKEQMLETYKENIKIVKKQIRTLTKMMQKAEEM